MTQTNFLAPAEPEVAKTARISDCGRYRYQLTRIWNEATYCLPILMLNPSTADAAKDDPTIRRCMAFARREGFGGIIVANLFAFRATSPADMKAAADPVGAGNDTALDGLFRASVGYNTPVLAAWGNHGDHRNRATAVRGLARAIGAHLVCLGTTDLGHPRHPLYVPGTQAFEAFA
jgi:hypothetical protein